MNARALMMVVIALALGACATTPPLETSGVDPDLTPAQSTESLDLANGRRIHWGGVIIAGRNLESESQLEMLAYPLTGNGRPDTDRKPLKRFLAVKKGYLETLDYSAGRIASFVGTLQPSRTGRIGDSDYRYPVLAIEQSRLWSDRGHTQPQFRIGIGIGISN